MLIPVLLFKQMEHTCPAHFRSPWHSILATTRNQSHFHEMEWQ